MFIHHLECSICHDKTRQTTMVGAPGTESRKEDFQPDKCICGGKRVVTATEDFEDLAHAGNVISNDNESDGA